MNKKRLRILAVFVLIGGIACLASVSEEFSEVNSMTGAYRKKERRGYILTEPWHTRTTWIVESAERQGISTESGWQYLGKITYTLIVRQRACGRAPASYSLSVATPEDLGLDSQAKIDAFTREFVSADEVRRKEMLSEFR